MLKKFVKNLVKSPLSDHFWGIKMGRKNVQKTQYLVKNGRFWGVFGLFWGKIVGFGQMPTFFLY
jgi:hypothetical protein